ncbi:polysaccharide deacetylase family protein [Streptomyces sp. NPDC093260]|uniref:polysaccharide deacetylase family protein n=1 Tax=Streptomyces sp. NPDC093260 TaxID=3155073 RepID=UPI00341D0CAA
MSWHDGWNGKNGKNGKNAGTGGAARGSGSRAGASGAEDATGRPAVSRGRRYAAVAGVVAVALTAGGCAGDGRGGADGARAGATAGAHPSASPGGARRTAPGVSAATWRKWGLKPLPAAPEPPADKPVKLSATGPVPVFSHIPTSRKVVFITVDDGQEKDPRFIAMMRDLKIPITLFLMNDAVKSDYAYFKPLQEMGDHIQNHTLHHPAMNTVPLARQKEEVCGAQRVLTEEYGTAPLLFRPPYGAYDTATKTAVGECGPRAIVWWRESMQITDMQYQTGDKKLRPGDIILAHFRGPSELKGATMTEMFADLLKRIRGQGFAVARLEDYIQAPAD